MWPSQTETDTITDRWQWIPAFAFILAFFVFFFLIDLPDTSGLAFLFFMLFAPFVALGILVWAGVLAYYKLFRRLGSLLLAVLLPLLLHIPIGWAAECLHLAVALPSYKIEGDFQAFDWSAGLIFEPQTFLIHDTSDEIAKLLSQHKHYADFENDFEHSCAGNVRHLVGHYYVCVF